MLTAGAGADGAGTSVAGAFSIGAGGGDPIGIMTAGACMGGARFCTEGVSAVSKGDTAAGIGVGAGGVDEENGGGLKLAGIELDTGGMALIFSAKDMLAAGAAAGVIIAAGISFGIDAGDTLGSDAGGSALDAAGIRLGMDVADMPGSNRGGSSFVSVGMRLGVNAGGMLGSGDVGSALSGAGLRAGNAASDMAGVCGEGAGALNGTSFKKTLEIGYTTVKLVGMVMVAEVCETNGGAAGSVVGFSQGSKRLPKDESMGDWVCTCGSKTAAGAGADAGAIGAVSD